MTLIDRLLFWTAERRGFKVVEPVDPADGIPAHDVDRDEDVISARRHTAIFQRKLDHLDAMAESLGLKVPSRGDRCNVDF